MNKKGFTILELLLAITFFSGLLLFVVTGFIQITRSYTQGLTVKEVQNGARDVVDQIEGAIRDSNGALTFQTAPNRVCVGGVRFAWNMFTSDSFASFTTESFADSPTNDEITFARTTAGLANCAGPVEENPSAGTTQKVLSDGLAIQHLEVNQIGTSKSFEIIVVVSTDARVLESDFGSYGANAACNVQVGDEYCDIARYQTVVTARN